MNKGPCTFLRQFTVEFSRLKDAKEWITQRYCYEIS